MGRAYRETHPDEPYDLTQPAGIFDELKDEAVEDAAEVTAEAAQKLSAGAANLTAGTQRSFRAAVEHPSEFGEFTLRSLERYIRHNPFEAVTVFAGFAFAIGGLWGLRRRDRERASRIQPYQPVRYEMVRTFADTPGDASEYSDRNTRPAEGAANSARELASDALDRFSTVANEAVEHPQRFARETLDSVSRYTKEKPLQALGIAAGVAFVIGALWKR